AALDAVARFEEGAMKAIEECVEHADAEHNLLAVRGPLRRENVACGIAEDDLERVAADRRERDANSLRSAQPRSDERIVLPIGTERRPTAGEGELVPRVTTEGLDPRLS